MIKSTLILLLIALCCPIKSIGNPGLLISIPFPQNLPPVPIGLPLQIDDIVISLLELTNIYAREVDYEWKFEIDKAEVKISFARISFDWSYKKDKGIGYFTE